MAVEDDYDEYGGYPADDQDGGSWGLFDEPVEQEGPDLFADEPDAVPAPAAPAPAAPAAPAVRRAAAPEAPPAPLALYRRYRPDTFTEVIGQEHVTVPLQRALDNNRVNHAYLFSGPRGCGKTTSARILARCLNCEQGPTSTPCGVCQSCIDLARGGPGSIDVIEIDAASHGGVDDARDLRERAFFAPVSSRYKIYIVDEAHMVTTAGFNALLKLVEEPPPHAKFVFATTEPEKVIGTIRSRTHHYPFRLVPPKVLGDYLEQICGQEGVVVEHAALPLVVRAGAGSVRDSLSVLDQLLGGAGEDGVTYSQAAALLGYTPDSLLDDIMDAFAAGDAAGVFSTIDKVIEVGQDPRRFAEDLLRRLRDLVILAAVPEAASNGMLEVSADQAQRLATQAAGMGQGELTRAAEVIAVGLTEMRGTTAPRLHLELMCSRVLLPAADAGERGLHARMDRLERRVGMLGDAEPTATVPAPEQPAEPPAQRPATQRPAAQRPAAQQSESQPPAAERPPAQQRPVAPPAQPAPAAAAARQGPRTLTAAELRRIWPDVLEEVKRRRRFTYMMLSQHAQVLDVSDGQLLLGFTNPGARESFGNSGSIDVLADSLIQVVGVELRIQAIVSSESVQARQAPAHQAPARENAAPAPAAAPASAPVEDVEETGAAEDDEPLGNVDEAASGLLTDAFGAEIIGVEESGRGGTT